MMFLTGKDNDMKRIIVLLFFTLLGCEYKSDSRYNNEIIRTIDGNFVEILTIDSCQYVSVSGMNGVGLSHKGNCKFCAQRGGK